MAVANAQGILLHKVTRVVFMVELKNDIQKCRCTQRLPSGPLYSHYITMESSFCAYKGRAVIPEREDLHWVQCITTLNEHGEASCLVASSDEDGGCARVADFEARVVIGL
jgi:hypothetical protein